jgi:hypothetical protein
MRSNGGSKTKKREHVLAQTTAPAKIEYAMNSDLQTSRNWVRGFVLTGALLLALGIAQFFEPSDTVGSSRSLIAQLATSLFGPKGPAASSVILALFFLYAARFIWRRTGKKPSDRLWF